MRHSLHWWQRTSNIEIAVEQQHVVPGDLKRSHYIASQRNEGLNVMFHPHLTSPVKGERQGWEDSVERDGKWWTDLHQQIARRV